MKTKRSGSRSSWPSNQSRRCLGRQAGLVPVLFCASFLAAQNNGEGDLASGLEIGRQKGLQVLGPLSAQMNAEDASGEMTQRYPEPALVFSPE